MPKSLYDLLTPEARARHPLESLDGPVAEKLTKPIIPDGYNPERSAKIGALIERALPQMGQMRAATNRVRAGQRGELGGRGGGGSWSDQPRPVTAAGQRTTSEMVEGANPAVRAVAHFGASAAQAMPNVSEFGIPGVQPYSTRDLVPPATNPAEHVADIAGGLAGFVGTTSAGTAIGLPPTTAVGMTGALQEGSPMERAVRGFTLAGTAGLTHGAGAALAGEAPGVARGLVSRVPAAIGFGAAEPFARTQIMRLTGEDPGKSPGLKDATTGSLEMLAIELVLGGKGIVSKGRENVAAAKARLDSMTDAERTILFRRAQKVAQTIAMPKGAELAPSLEQDLTQKLGGRRISIPAPGGGLWAGDVERVVAYTMPGGGSRIGLVMRDAAGDVAPVTFNSLEQLTAAVQPFRPEGNRIADLPTAPESVPLKGTGGHITAERLKKRGAKITKEGFVQAEKDSRLGEIEASLAGLEKSRPPKGDKGYRRWAQRVERLTAEQSALRGTGTVEAPSPAPVAPITEAPKPSMRKVRPAKAEVPQKAAAPAPDPDADLDLFSDRPKPKAGAETPVVAQKVEGKVSAPEPAAARAVADMEGVGTASGEPGGRVVGDVKYRVTASEGGAVTLHHLENASGIRGEGSRALKALTDKADAHGVAMETDATPIQTRGGRGKVPLDNLVAFYEKHGFVVTKRGPNNAEMRREPVKGGGGTDARTSEPAQGTAAPATKPKGKPLEQQSLEGMPKPELPKGPKRSANDESADVLRGMMEKPEPPKQGDLLKPEGPPGPLPDRGTVRVYHGSATLARKGLEGGAFKTSLAPGGFERGEVGIDALGTWFTPSRADANRFAEHYGDHGKLQPGAMVEADVTYEKPLIFEDSASYMKWAREQAEKHTTETLKPGQKGQLPSADAAKIRAELRAQGYDAILIRGGGKGDRTPHGADYLLALDPARAKVSSVEGAKPAESVEEPTGARGLKPSEKVRVPYTGPKRVFGKDVVKKSETGEVLGYTDKGEVRVFVHRGKGGFEATFPEGSVTRLATTASKKAAAEGRAKKALKMDTDLEARIGDSPAKATAIIREYQGKANALSASIEGDMNSPEYTATRRVWKAAMEAVHRAEAIRDRLLERSPVTGEAARGGLDPDAKAILTHGRESDGHAWTNPLRTAAEDYPDHFTPKRQMEIVRQANTGAIGNTREMRAHVEAERDMVEAGVPSEVASYAADKTAHMRRYIEQERENPLYDAGEVEAATKWVADLLNPTKLKTKAAVDAAIEEFNRRNPPSPAGDIPMGTVPDPLGFKDLDVGDKGAASIEAMRALGGIWTQVLRGVPARLKAAWRSVPRHHRPRITDQAGNVMVRTDNHGEWDHFSNSMWTRFYTLVAGSKLSSKERILTPDREMDLNSAGPATIAYQGRWRGWFEDAWGPELLGRAKMFSTVSRDVARVLSGQAKPSILPREFRGVPDKIEAVYQKIRADVNSVRQSMGDDPIMSFGVRRTKYNPNRWLVSPDARINMPEGTYTDTGQTTGDGWRVIETDGREVVTRYGGPHLMFDSASSMLTKTMEAILGEKAKDSETLPEITSRFLNKREGKSSQIEDASYQMEQYIGSMSRMAAHAPFFKGIENELKDMDTQGDHARARVTRAWLRAQFARSDDPITQLISGAFNAATFKRNPNLAVEMSKSAAQHTADSWGQQDHGFHNKYWRVPAEAELANREDVKVVATSPDGARLVGTSGRPPLDGKRTKLRGPARGLALKRIREEAANAEKAGELPEGMTRAQYAASLLRRHRTGVEHLKQGSGQSFFRGARYMQHLALLGYNIKAGVANLLQPMLTLGPEVGYFGRSGAIASMGRQAGQAASKTTAQAVRAMTALAVANKHMTVAEAAKWWRKFPVGRTGADAARMTGLLSGEVQRLNHERSVGEVDTRLGAFTKGYGKMLEPLGPMANFSAAEDFTRGAAFLSAISDARRLGLPSSVVDRVLEPGTPDYYDTMLEAAKEMRTQGTATRHAARRISNTMFDYNRYGRPPIFNTPLGGLVGLLTTFPTQFAGRYAFRPIGGAAKVVGAAVKRGLTGPQAPATPQTRAAGPFGVGPDFVPRGGDTWSTTPLGRFLREGGATGYDIQGAKMFARMAAFTGVALGSSLATGVNLALSGTPGWDILVLKAMRAMWPDDENVKKAYALATRSAAINPDRGVPMSPTASAAVKIMAGQGAGRHAAEYAQTFLPLKVAIGRYLQNRQDASRLLEGGDLHWLGQAFGIRSVTPSENLLDEAAGNLGMRSRAVDDQRRQNIKTPKRREKASGTIGAIPQRAKAVA